MTALNTFRNKIRQIFAAGDIYIMPVLKFILAFGVLTIINKKLGYLPILDSLFLVIILSILCAIMPFTGTAVIGAVFIVLHCFGLHLLIGVAAVALYLLILILVMRFVPKDTPALVLGPVAGMLGFPGAVPLVLGLAGNAGSALSAVMTVLSMGFLRQLPATAALLEAGELSNLEVLQKLIDDTLLNSSTILAMIVAAAAVLAVCFLKKILTGFTWLISAAAGAAAYLILTYVGTRVLLETSPELKPLLLDTVISFCIAVVVAFFLHSLDYSRARNVQFEDDDYYYYVKAVPKNVGNIAQDSPIEFSEEDDDEGGFRKGLENTLQDL